MRLMPTWVLCALAVLAAPAAYSAEGPVTLLRGDQMVTEYFRQETQRLADRSLSEIRSAADWNARRDEFRTELFEMLGLDPLPERTPLSPQVTGTVRHDEFHVENVHFQSRPGLYVTGNLYVPNQVSAKLPAILYVCGHGGVKKDGISYGNKVHYQHHGAWFARNGYVCLVIDTLQLGEIEGIHHGTYRYDMWWWLNYGYTSAGVEAWNCIRALDYLQSRPEVDPERLGVTGRSGGGAYSWWIAALDERIRCAVPVAGITDLTNHVVDGCVEGHCDCMYMVNTFRWDYPQVAALVAPRPLLISNTDSDGIFPLDGVVRLFERTRRVYSLLGARDQVALNITAGGHHDTQELQVHAFRWFNQHLKGDKSLIEKTAVPFFEPEQLRVFRELPADERNTQIQESFVALAAPKPPDNPTTWASQRDTWRQQLDDRVFAGWPQEAEPLDPQPAFRHEHGERVLRAFDFTSQGPFRLRLYLLHSKQASPSAPIELTALNADQWRQFVATLRPAFAAAFEGESEVHATPDDLKKSPFAQRLAAMDADPNGILAFVAPRGVGPTAWDPSPKKQIQHQRRFYLLGQSLDGMRVWDIRRAIQTLHSLPELQQSILLSGDGPMAGNVLYAALYEPRIAGLRLSSLPSSHRAGPYFLNVQRFLDTPMAVAMAAERVPVTLTGANPADWEWAIQTQRQLQWKPASLLLVQE